MNDNSWNSNTLDGLQMFYAQSRSSQPSDSEEVRLSGTAREDAAGDDFTHATLPNLLAVSEIRSWAVQPSAQFWRNPQPINDIQAIHPRQDVPKPDAKRKSPVTSKFIRWIRFNAVGALGIAVQMAALFLLKSLLHLHYLVATALAVEAAVVHNFVWHERFTWLDRVRAAAQGSWLRMLRFNLTTGGLSIVGNLVLMKLLAGMAHMNYFVANAIAIAICSLANFVASDEWVFE
jgi:putative flippase GtrA